MDEAAVEALRKTFLLDTRSEIDDEGRLDERWIISQHRPDLQDDIPFRPRTETDLWALRLVLNQAHEDEDYEWFMAAYNTLEDTLREYQKVLGQGIQDLLAKVKSVEMNATFPEES
jgi:hypothetical protein